MFINFFISYVFAEETTMENRSIYNEIIDTAEKEDWSMVYGDEDKDHDNVYQIHSFKNNQEYLLLRDKNAQVDGVNLILSPKGDKAAFWIDENYSSYALYIVNSDGARKTQLLRVASGGWNAWSPDGKKIAFLSDVVNGGGFAKEASLYVIDIDTKAVNKILTKEIDDMTYQAWSPSGDKIVYNYRGKMFIYDFKQNKRVSLCDGLSPSWSPVGEKILFYNRTRKSLDLLRLDSVVNHKNDFVGEELVSSEKLGKGNIVAPFYWFPDGNYIFIGHLAPSETEIGLPYVLKVESKKVEKLSDVSWYFSSWAKP